MDSTKPPATPLNEIEEIGKSISNGQLVSKEFLDTFYDLYRASLEASNGVDNIGSTIPKEYELNYAGKMRKEEVISSTKIAPLQLIRQFKSDVKTEEKWENKLILGDNLKVLKTLTGDSSIHKKIKLIYIDPPFATKKDFMKDEVKAYADKVVGSAFIEFTRQRLILLKELLAPDGTIFVHIDQKKGHYIKIILDEIFGENNFRNEIIWSYGLGGSSPRYFPQKHDNIFWYSNSDNYYFKPPMIPATSQRMKGEDKKCPDTWNIPSINNMAIERLAYPTQKPEALLERIIECASVQGDLILDAFAGSGTTLAVAEKLGRRWVGIDCGKLSIYTIQSRLLDLREEIGNKGKPVKVKNFSIYRAGLYDYKEIEAMDQEHYRKFVLQLFQIRDKKHVINGVEVDGQIKTRSVLLWKHKDKKNIVINDKYVKSLHEALGGKGGSIFYVIAPNSAFEFPEDIRLVGETEYRFLRIPQSIIDELIQSKGKALIQPRSEGNINDTVDAIAFDFMRAPEIKRVLSKGAPKDENLLNIDQTFYQIKITKFKSNGSANLESRSDFKYLAMILIDKKYNGKFFSLSQAIFAESITDGEIEFLEENVGDKIMIIYVDIYGNEFNEVLSKSEFGK
jgi:site-specific DNA-methyltransferase (adenine-specific)/adenine-specific DNA-methyltransferase